LESRKIFDGRSISLDPSIGNWGFQCRSHYWIKNNRVVWAESENDLGKKRDARVTAAQKEKSPENPNEIGSAPGQKPKTKTRSFKSVVKKWFGGES
jgi:Family of unknown function (DUF6527)